MAVSQSHTHIGDHLRDVAYLHQAGNKKDNKQGLGKRMLELFALLI